MLVKSMKIRYCQCFLSFHVIRAYEALSLAIPVACIMDGFSSFQCFPVKHAGHSVGPSPADRAITTTKWCNLIALAPSDSVVDFAGSACCLGTNPRQEEGARNTHMMQRINNLVVKSIVEVRSTARSHQPRLPIILSSRPTRSASLRE